jgi:hypothetical protein
MTDKAYPIPLIVGMFKAIETDPRLDDDYEGEQLERVAVYISWVVVRHLKPDFEELQRHWRFLTPTVRRRYRDDARALINYMESE